MNYSTGSVSIILWLCAVVLTHGHIDAQTTPAISSKSKIQNQVGFQTITVEYGRPSAYGRKIFGSLVPYERVWRTGANYPTFITFEDSVFVEDHLVLPGKYALYTIPSKVEWTIVLSKNTNLWGAFGYNEKDDVMRAVVKPFTVDYTETFTISFSKVGQNSAILNLSWEELSVPIRIFVNDIDEVMRRVNESVASGEADWGTYYHGAKYLLNTNQELPTALHWIDRSLKLEKNWMNLWTKAELFALAKDFSKAIDFGSDALRECKSNEPYCAYSKTYEETISAWKRN